MFGMLYIFYVDRVGTEYRLMILLYACFALGETHMTKLNIRPLTHVDISRYCARLEYIALLNQHIA